MEKDIFNIIEAKEYNQLSVEELDMVAEFCESEDEYRQMKSVLLGVSSMSFNSESPRQATKDKLDDLFAVQSFPKAAPIWYNKIGMMLYPKDKKMYQRPLFQLVAIFILLLGIVPFLMTSNATLQKEQLAKNELDVPESNLIDHSLDKEVMTLDSQVNKSKDVLVLMNDSEQSEPEFKQDKMTVFDESVPGKMKSADDLKDMNLEVTTGSISRSAASHHSDGIFGGTNSGTLPNYSIALIDQEEVLDLLTATF